MQKLRIFATVARERSFTKAAEAILLSAPAISDQIKSLESLIGIRLLHRSRGSSVVELTEAGEILLRSYHLISQSIEKAEQELEGIKGLEHGTVAVGLTQTFGDHFLPVIYHNFRRAQPGIKVRLHVGWNEHILENLARRQIDLAVLLGPTQQIGLVSEPLVPSYMVAVGPPGHRLAGAAPALFGELAKESLVLGDPSTYLRKVLDRMAAEAGISLNVVLEVSNAEARLQTVLRGLGITVLSTQLVAGQIAAGNLCMLRIEGFPIRIDWFVVHPAAPLSPSAQALKDYLLQSRDMLEDQLSTTDNVLLGYH